MADGALHPTLRENGVFVPFDAVLPRICTFCGVKKKALVERDKIGPDDLHPVAYGSPVAALTANLLVVFIRASRAKGVTLPHYRCERCDRRAREDAGIPFVLLVGPFVAVLFGIIGGFGASAAWGWGIGLATFAVVLVIARMTSTSGVSVVAIEPEGVVLRGLSARAVQRLTSADDGSERAPE